MLRSTLRRDSVRVVRLRNPHISRCSRRHWCRGRLCCKFFISACILLIIALLHQVFWFSEETELLTQLASICPRPPVDCPSHPPHLNGRLNVSPTPVWLSEDQVEAQVGPMGPGGSWRPPDCTPRHSVAIIIPYRDRWEQLMALLHLLHPILRRQQLQYRIFVVEQAGHYTYNKGMLMNAGFLTAIKFLPEPGVIFHCFVFHDVDMLPEDDRNMYSCPIQPRHMSVAVNELNYKLPYRQLAGGVFAAKTEHIFELNGYSNLYWGWGGEDDDMGIRVEQVFHFVLRSAPEFARYTMIKHKKRKPLEWATRKELLRTAKRRFRLDGLNTLQFSLLNISEHWLFTHLLVDIGLPPHEIRLLQQHQDYENNKTSNASYGLEKNMKDRVESLHRRLIALDKELFLRQFRKSVGNRMNFREKHRHTVAGATDSMDAKSSQLRNTVLIHD